MHTFPGPLTARVLGAALLPNTLPAACAAVTHHPEFHANRQKRVLTVVQIQPLLWLQAVSLPAARDTATDTSCSPGSWSLSVASSGPS